MAPSAHERQFLDPMVVARLGTLELKARTIVEGFLSGLHRSPFKGFSVEFAEYRQYIPGDDLSTIDWKVYARSDRHYVKKFEEETNLDCHVMLDVSASMGYGSGGMTKHHYSQCLAASLGYLMNRQRDRVGLTAFDDRDRRDAAGQRAARPSACAAAHPRSAAAGPQDERVEAPPSARRFALEAGHGVLISDLLDEPQSVIRGLKHFQFRGTDVIVFHVLDPDERTFPFERSTRFEDLETSEEVTAVPAVVREHYLEAIDGLIERYQRELGACGIDYHLLTTDQPLELALLAYLSTRERKL